MEKTLIMCAMLLTGVAMASPQLTTTITPMSIQLQEEKVKIEPNDLPDPVKNAIIGDEIINKFPVDEAWKVTQSEGVFHYIVTFENGTEEKLSKKYDEEGVEIKD